MTLSETAGIMAILETAYPSYYAKQDKRKKQEAVMLWAELFSDDPLDLVGAAVKAYITAENQFPPSIGTIKAKMRELANTEPELTEQKAWSLVSKACSNGLYGWREEYAKLPDSVQKAVGMPEMLREWAMMDTDTVNSVVASNFMRSFRVIQQRERDMAALPESVKRMLPRPAFMLEAGE